MVRITPQGAHTVINLAGERSYDRFLGKVNGIPGRVDPSGIAVDRHGDIYLCAGADGNGTFTGIVEVQPNNRVRVLWTPKPQTR
ncbi:MAG: SBBP repeat-containing protein [Solirubrobacteraceae bacterium]